MSAFIGHVNAPHHNSPTKHAEVWASLAGVEFVLFSEARLLDPTAARDYAALLVRAADESERMRGASEADRLRVALQSIGFECAHGQNADVRRIEFTAREALGVKP